MVVPFLMWNAPCVYVLWPDDDAVRCVGSAYRANMQLFMTQRERVAFRFSRTAWPLPLIYICNRPSSVAAV